MLAGNGITAYGDGDYSLIDGFKLLELYKKLLDGSRNQRARSYLLADQEREALNVSITILCCYAWNEGCECSRALHEQ